MCGIIGYVGPKLVEQEVFNGLKKLEYRGYDSAGMLTVNKNGFFITKSLGKVDYLGDKISHYENSVCGIGHTRWATHGKVSLQNAHPQCSNNNVWAIVHNGVVENYEQLKHDFLEEYTFYGETDTEIIANLLEFNQNLALKNNRYLSEEDYINIFIKTCNMLKGSYSIVAVNKDFPNSIFLGKNKSPLYISYELNNIYVASDVCCFQEKSTSFFELEDKEFCFAKIKNEFFDNNSTYVAEDKDLSANKIDNSNVKIEFFNKNSVSIMKKTKKLSNIDNATNTNYHQSFMQKEIMEIPECLKTIYNYYNPKTFKNLSLEGIDNVILIGCGTAYHACCVGKIYFEEILKINASSYIASEFNCSRMNINKRTLAIFISQSGETLDTLIAKKHCKNKHARVVVITNVMHSSLVKKTKYVLPILAGPEIAVASTKAYNCQLAVLFLLCNFLKGIKYFEKAKISVKALFRNFKIDKEKVFELVNLLTENDNIFLLGKKLDYITALESSLKIKEITYKNANAYACGELKHGYIALINQNSTAFVFATDKKLLDKTLICCNEIKSRGAKVILITQLELKDKTLNSVDIIINIGKCSALLSPILSIVPIQIISEKLSRQLGHDPDKPKNLAKSVTVE